MPFFGLTFLLNIFFSLGCWKQIDFSFFLMGSDLDVHLIHPSLKKDASLGTDRKFDNFFNVNKERGRTWFELDK